MSSSPSLSNSYSLTTPISALVKNTPSPTVDNTAEVIPIFSAAPMEQALIRDIFEKVVISSSNEQSTEPTVPNSTKEQGLQPTPKRRRMRSKIIYHSTSKMMTKKVCKSSE